MDTMTENEKQELEFLRHFYQNADFGPADEDVRRGITSRYSGVIPEGYREEDE